jgi:signal peptidase I
MMPTLQEKDWLMVRMHLPEVRRGDMVVFKLPEDETKLLCRRAVGLPGDKITTRFYANVKITTVYSQAHLEGEVFPAGINSRDKPYNEQETIVEPGKVFVVGDNAVPGASYDSDDWGLLPMENLVGRVERRLEPNPKSF